MARAWFTLKRDLVNLLKLRDETMAEYQTDLSQERDRYPLGFGHQGRCKIGINDRRSEYRSESR